jgi:ATP-dependent Clp protease ATP-binding subunit ClpX
MPAENKESPSDAWCSFCRRNHRDVGPLMEGPDQVYICYACARLGVDMIEKEARRQGVTPPVYSSSR